MRHRHDKEEGGDTVPVKCWVWRKEEGIGGEERLCASKGALKLAL